MAGLARICKLHGSIRINGVRWVWDYAADKAVLETEMPMGSPRHAESERALARMLMDELGAAVKLQAEV